MTPNLDGVLEQPTFLLRCVSVGSSALALCLTVRTARADPPAELHPRALECRSSGSKEHQLGPVLDIAMDADSAGVRYHHTHTGGSGCGGLGFMGWLGYGADLRGVFEGALSSYLTARAGFMGDAMAIAIEAGAGGGTDFASVAPSGIVGLFFSFYRVDLGVSYEFPIGDDRPAWVGGVGFAARGYIPISAYDEYDQVDNAGSSTQPADASKETR